MSNGNDTRKDGQTPVAPAAPEREKKSLLTWAGKLLPWKKKSKSKEIYPLF
jgi:hypothetical protein